MRLWNQGFEHSWCNPWINIDVQNSNPVSVVNTQGIDKLKRSSNETKRKTNSSTLINFLYQLVLKDSLLIQVKISEVQNKKNME